MGNFQYDQEYYRYQEEFDEQYRQNSQLLYPQDEGRLETNSERQMGTFIHLSPLASLLVPLAGLILPIVLWQTNKNDMPAVDIHGKEVINWIITSFLITIFAIILTVFGVIFGAAIEFPPMVFLAVMFGILSFMGVFIVNIIFAIMGGIKANNGELWEYPFNIKFFK